MGCVVERSCRGCCAVAVPVAVGLGAHQPDRRLPLAQQRQGRRGQVPTATTTATSLACFIFRFLRRPQVDLAAMLEGRKVDLRSLTDGIDTKGAPGRFFFNVMAALAVMERELILERTMAGLVAAKRAGKIGGRKPSMTPAKLDAARKL